MICPSCRQDAPTIVRGVRAYCTSCGAPRPLLGSNAVNVAGKPSKIGGGVASVVGWVVLFLGSMFSVAMGALFNMLWSIANSAAATAVGLWVGGFFGVITLVVALSFLLGGRKLRQTGVDDRRKVLEQGIFALAGKQRGSVTPRDVARQLAITDEEADALLTDLAKKADGRVTLDVDDDGTLRYTVPELLPPVRIDPGAVAGAGAGAVKAPKVRVAPGPVVLDAEFEEDEADGEAAEKNRESRKL